MRQSHREPGEGIFVSCKPRLYTATSHRAALVDMRIDSRHCIGRRTRQGRAAAVSTVQPANTPAAASAPRSVATSLNKAAETPARRKRDGTESPLRLDEHRCRSQLPRRYIAARIDSPRCPRCPRAHRSRRGHPMAGNSCLLLHQCTTYLRRSNRNRCQGNARGRNQPHFGTRRTYPCTPPRQLRARNRAPTLRQSQAPHESLCSSSCSPLTQ